MPPFLLRKTQSHVFKWPQTLKQQEIAVKKEPWELEMAQPLRALTTLVEDPCSGPITHTTNPKTQPGTRNVTGAS